MSQPKRPLSGNLLKLKEGIFDKGQRLTCEEWAHVLFGKRDLKTKARVYTIITRLGVYGFIAISVLRDPDEPHEPGVYTPLTETEEVVRIGNARIVAKLNGAILKYGLYATEELLVFPSMKAEIVSTFQETISNLASQHKLLTAQTSYVKQQLPSGTR